MAMEDQLVSIFMNYGIAGLILLVFYMLFKNELSQLRASIEKLDERIDKLAERIEGLRVAVEELRRKG